MNYLSLILTLTLLFAFLIVKSRCIRLYTNNLIYRNFIQKKFSRLSYSLNASSAPSEYYFNQTLDHFDLTSTRKWPQRYWISSTHFVNKSGPVFLVIGGEAEESGSTLVFMQVNKYAKKYNALLVLVEHRFFGQSRPFK